MQHRSCSVTEVEAGEGHHCLSCMPSLCECQQRQFTQRICCPSVSLLNEEMLKMKLRHRDGFYKWNFANLLSFTSNTVVRKAQLPCKSFGSLPQFPVPSHDQDEDVHAVFLPAQVTYSSFSPLQGSTSPGCPSTCRSWVLSVLNAGH